MTDLFTDPYDDLSDEELDMLIENLFSGTDRRDNKRKTHMIIDGAGIKRVAQALKSKVTKKH